jgi:hypothetical protein
MTKTRRRLCICDQCGQPVVAALWVTRHGSIDPTIPHGTEQLLRPIYHLCRVCAAQGKARQHRAAAAALEAQVPKLKAARAAGHKAYVAALPPGDPLLVAVESKRGIKSRTGAAS